MKLRFLGTGAAFNPSMGNTNAMFRHGEDLFLIDCGEQAFTKLLQAGTLTAAGGRIVVLLTHMHADHCGSLGTLCLYAATVLGRPITIVHPNEDVRALLALMGAAEQQYTLLAQYDDDGIRAVPHPVQHVPAIPSYAYVLSDEEETIYYSGDTGVASLKMLESLRTGAYAHAYLDTNLYDEPLKRVAHIPFSDLLWLVEKPLRRRITLMHFNRDFSALAEQEGFLCARTDPEFV